MKFKNSRWMIVVGVVMAFLVLGTIVWASPPVSPPYAPPQGTPGFDADLLDGHDSAYSAAATNAQRANRFLWATPNGRFSIRSLPLSQLNNRYVFKYVANTIQAASKDPVLTVENTLVASGGKAIRAVNHSDSTWRRPAIEAVSYGDGAAVFALSLSPGGDGVEAISEDGVAVRAKTYNGANIIEAWYGTTNDRRFYVSSSGQVYADGTYHSYGADLAEMLPAADGLEPGDVLVVGRDGRLSCSTISNSTDVAGVYSTQPGFLGSSGDESDLTGMVPLAIAGVVPVKASAENGPIQPGHLLTTSSTPGHAMNASPVTADGITFYLPGTILGKALEPLEDGTGVILVLVTLQ